MPQAPYLPGMAPCDLFLFSKIKRTLNGHNFTSIEYIESDDQTSWKPIFGFIDEKEVVKNV